MPTVEAIQVELIGSEGIILWPGSPEDPPRYICDEDIWYENPRVFPKPNELNPVFKYKLSQSQMRWYLVDGS